MNFRPILFSTNMVQAILYGNKTQTRRVVKEFVDKEILSVRAPDGIEIGKFGKDGWRGELPSRHDGNAYGVEAKPPCKAGDILWVRETFDNIALGHPWYYKADGDLRPECWKGENWNPSIHMPREAARIFLRVTDVRMEQLQDISVLDAIHEGCCGVACDSQPSGWHVRPEDDFARLWDDTCGKKGCHWDDNPWVWVIEFERCDKPEGWCKEDGGDRVLHGCADIGRTDDPKGV